MRFVAHTFQLEMLVLYSARDLLTDSLNNYYLLHKGQKWQV